MRARHNAGMRQFTVMLPGNFNVFTMHQFVAAASERLVAERAEAIQFDFSGLRFIAPEGVVALSNAIEHFRQRGIPVYFVNHTKYSEATQYLDDAGFFRHYLKKNVFMQTAPRSTTMPLQLFNARAYVPYLYQHLMPWIGSEVQLSTDSLETIKTCLEEVFHNIDFHSGVDTGCTFSQHFPVRKRIGIAVSDWGVGIPFQVRSVLPELNDHQAIQQACKEGFTTKGNVNRGAGLPNLIRYVAQRNSGVVRIHSGCGAIVAQRGPEGPRIEAHKLNWSYPGTLVHVVLRTDTLEKLETDVKPEAFKW